MLMIERLKIARMHENEGGISVQVAEFAKKHLQIEKLVIYLYILDTHLRA